MGQGHQEGVAAGMADELTRWVSLAQLHAETGLAIRTLQYIRTQEPGVLIWRQRGKLVEYEQPSCAANLFRREREKATKEPADLEQARARKVAAEAQIAELELAKLRGQLLTVGDYGAALERSFDLIRARLVALPGRLAPLVTGVTTLPAAVAAIEPVVSELLQELSSDDTPAFDEDAA